MRNNKKEIKKIRYDVEVNRALIREAFIAALKKNKGQRPTAKEIADESGLCALTVQKHIKELDFKDLISELACYKLLTDDVIIAMYRTAMKGNVGAQKLWLQVIEDWSEKIETEHSGSIETTPPLPPVIVRIGK